MTPGVQRSDDRSEGGSPEPRLEESVIYAQDVKCLLCGLVLGQLIGRTSLPPNARRFNPARGQAVPVGFHAARARCFRCGGVCFLDEVETSVVIRAEAFEKPRRGRKPKPRPGAEQAIAP